MNILRQLPVVAGFVFILSGCVSDNVISQEELQVQDSADNVVSSVLFEKNLDGSASYNIRKDGFVVIQFDDTVTTQQYTDVVNALRSSSSIRGVRGEQGGAEVCGFSPR